MNWKRYLHFCLLVGMMLLSSLSPTFAQKTVDEKVDFVQSHLHFKDPTTAADVTHDHLKAVLTKTVGQTTYLDQAYTLAALMDTKSKFDNNNYNDFAADIITAVFDIYGLNIPNWKEIGLGTLATVLRDFYPAVSILLDIWDGYRQYVGGSLDTIQSIINVWTSIVTNRCMVAYVAVCSDPDDDKDAWDIVSPLAQVSNPEDVHTFCRNTFKVYWRLRTTFAGELDQLKNNINALIKGSVVFSYSPGYYTLYAPINMTIDASNSSGTFGSSIVSYKWKLDGVDAGTNSSITQTFWTPGLHTVTVAVTDDKNNTQIDSSTFAVSTPPIDLDGVLDLTNLVGKFKTPNNPLVTDYKWDFGDSSPPTEGASLTNVTHTFPRNGQYTVTLTETTTHGETVSTVRTARFQSVPTDISGGTISYSQTWDVGGSPYRVHGTLTIPAGVRLTLDAGVVLQFDNNTGFDVYGELVSNGQFSSQKRVYLTSYRDGSGPGVGGADTGAAGDWSGINLRPGATASLTAATIRYAYFGLQGSPRAISGSTFDNCYYGLYINGTGSNDVTVAGNFFSGTTLANAIWFNGAFGTLNMSDNRGVGGNADIYLSSVTLKKDNSWIPQTACRLRAYGALTVLSGTTLTLNAGCALQVSGRIDLRGAFRSTGTATQPVTLTSLNDDSPYGGTDSGGSWEGIYCNRLQSNIASFTIRHANKPVFGLTSLISKCVFDGCGTVNINPQRTTALTISGCTFLNSGGINDSCTLPLIVSGNTFKNSGGVYATGKGNNDVTLTNNSFSGTSIPNAASLNGGFGSLIFTGNKGDTDRATITLYSATLNKDNNWSLQTGARVWVSSPLTVAFGTTLTLNTGMALHFNYSYSDINGGLIVAGTLKTVGTRSKPVVLTTTDDNSPYGGTDKTTSGYYWSGVQYYSGLTADLTGCTLRHAYYGVFGKPSSVTGATFDQSGSINVSSKRTTALTISGCTFLNGGGISDGSTQPLIVSGNTFKNSGGISVTGTGNNDVTLTNNTFSGTSIPNAANLNGGFGSLIFTGNKGDTDRATITLNSVTLNKDNNWSLQTGARVWVSGPLNVAFGTTLTLNTGMALHFASYYTSSSGIVVAGTLKTVGTRSKPVVFTTTDDNSPYGGTDKTTNGYYWSGVEYLAGLNADLTGCTVRHAYYGVSGTPSNISGATFDSCISAIGSSSARLTPLTISGCTFLSCSSGINDSSVLPLIVTGNTFKNSGGIGVGGTGNNDVTVTGNTFSGTSLGQAALFSGGFGTLTFSGNTGVGDLATITLSYVTVNKDNSWVAQKGCRVVCNGLDVPWGVNLTLGSGLVLQFTNYASFWVEGFLKSGGSSTKPVVLTSANDNSDYGGVDSGGYSDWVGLAFAQGITAKLSGVAIRHAGVGLVADNAKLSGCSFYQNSLGYDSILGGGSCTGCSFVKNGTAIYNEGNTSINATNSWWGDNSGPYNATTNRNGKGNPVTDLVLFIPWTIK